jgi:hypothetical protein
VFFPELANPFADLGREFLGGMRHVWQEITRSPPR